MSCLICAGQADTIATHGGWEERNCNRCGHYRMSRELVLGLMEQGQIFDVDKMRFWLKQRRSVEAVPTVELHEAFLLL
jgi:hypothetical protein